jgi:hypothetical protein
MSILKLASLVVTANAYEESKILAVVPSNGSGDLAFVRASTKTRVNPQGFIADTCKNIFRFSETFTNSYWVKTSSTVTANQGLSPLGTLTATRFNSTSTTSETQLRATIPAGNANEIYFTSVYVKKTTTRYFRIRTLFVQGGTGPIAVYFDLDNALVARQDGTLIGSITNEGNGWYRCSVRTIYGASGNIPLVDIGFMNVSGSQIASVPVEGLFWGAQLELSSTLTSYLQTTDRLNVPSIDYTGGGCPNILLEPQRTNLFVFSNDFANTYWNKANSSVSTSSEVSPNGTSDSIILNEGTTVNSFHWLQPSTSGVLVNNQVFTVSIFAKKLTRNGLVINIYNGVTSNFIIFNLDNGTVATSNTGDVTAKIEAFANGWYRCSYTRLIASTGSPNLIIGMANTSTFSYQGENKEILIANSQLEQGSFATSYIPTQASAVTRTADSFTKSNIFTNNFITSLGGTWFIEFKNNIPLIRDGFASGLALSASSTTDGIVFKNYGVSQRIQLIFRLNNIEFFAIVTTSLNPKIVIKWNGVNINVFENGIKIANNVAFSLTEMQLLNCSNTDVTRNISQMALFPTPLSDEECILLSSTSYNNYQEMATALNYINQ